MLLPERSTAGGAADTYLLPRPPGFDFATDFFKDCLP